MIGIICAMEIEAEKMKSLMENPETTRIGRQEFVKGFLRGSEVVIGVVGIGKVNAAMCTQAMILRYAPELIINSGVAGSLSPRFQIGDIAVATGVVQHDFDTTALGDPPAFFNELNGDTFPCDPEAVDAILKVAKQIHIRADRARLASGDQFISDAKAKKRLSRLFGAEICEMESGAIAHVCYNNGVRCAVIRSVSDSTDGEHHVEYSQFLPMAAENSANLLLAFLEDRN